MLLSKSYVKEWIGLNSGISWIIKVPFANPLTSMCVGLWKATAVRSGFCVSSDPLALKICLYKRVAHNDTNKITLSKTIKGEQILRNIIHHRLFMKWKKTCTYFFFLK